MRKYWAAKFLTFKKLQNLDLNISFDPSVALEEGVKMPKLYGPGFVGLQNLGNT